MDEKPNSRITRKTIGGTIYVVESMVSDGARNGVRQVKTAYIDGSEKPRKCIR